MICGYKSVWQTLFVEDSSEWNWKLENIEYEKPWSLKNDEESKMRNKMYRVCFNSSFSKMTSHWKLVQS